MAKVYVTKSLLDSLAQHINTKAGTTGAKTIAQMQATVDSIATADANHLRYTYNNPAAVSGGGNYITVVSGDETLKQVRSAETLVVIYRTAGTANCVKSCIGIGTRYLLPINNYDAASGSVYQSADRLRADDEHSPHQTTYALDDDTSLTTGSGRIYITPEGDLRIYGNTASYPIPAGEIIVDVLW